MPRPQDHDLHHDSWSSPRTVGGLVVMPWPRGRVKMFGYDASGATLRVPEEDPNLGQASCQGSLKLYLEGTCPRRGLAPPRAKCLVRITDVLRTLLS
uniref:Uncharacterized protein n=1 Tax=Solanum tuberosum TaxID=4113 RepID=M1DSZ2_SOLTU